MLAIQHDNACVQPELQHINKHAAGELKSVL
jgi:hypothetical protein